MDLVRSCYTARMRLWADSEEETEVRWTFADADAEWYPHPHSFGSWYTWERREFGPNTGIGEKSYLQYHNGGDPVGYPGDRRCGPDAAFLDGGSAARDEPIHTLADGSAPCCFADLVMPCGRYPRKLTLAAESEFNFCPCFGSDVFALKYVGYDPLPEADGNPGPRWVYDDEGSPWRRFGSCGWPVGGTVREAWARWDYFVPQFGLARCQPILRFRLAFKMGPDDFQGIMDERVGPTTLGFTPYHVVGGIGWRDIGTPGCGTRFGVPSNAGIGFDITGPMGVP